MVQPSIGIKSLPICGNITEFSPTPRYVIVERCILRLVTTMSIPNLGKGVSSVDECSHGTQHMKVGSSNNHLLGFRMVEDRASSHPDSSARTLLSNKLYKVILVPRFGVSVRLHEESRSYGRSSLKEPVRRNDVVRQVETLRMSVFHINEFQLQGSMTVIGPLHAQV